MQISYWILWDTQKNTKCVTDFFTNMMFFLAVMDPNKINLVRGKKKKKKANFSLKKWVYVCSISV